MPKGWKGFLPLQKERKGRISEKNIFPNERTNVSYYHLLMNIYQVPSILLGALHVLMFHVYLCI